LAWGALWSLSTTKETNVTTGRQDINAPQFDLEESEPIPEQEKRGQRLWLWIALVGAIFAAVIIIALVANNT
jgi:hypothetical protein